MLSYSAMLDVTCSGLHIRSASAIKFTERHQPDLWLTDHIHKAFGDGGSIVVNAEDIWMNAQLRYLA